VRHGLHQGDGGIVRLIAIAGIGTALDLALTGREVSADERRAILEYVRSDSRDVLESETDCESSGFGANIAAWLAVAGLVAAASPKKRIKRHIQKKVHQSQVFYK